MAEQNMKTSPTPLTDKAEMDWHTHHTKYALRDLCRKLEARHRLSPPESLIEMLRLKNPERVRQDWAEPGKPKTHVVIDDGENAGLTIAICHLEADAALMVALLNWARTLAEKATASMAER